MPDLIEAKLHKLGNQLPGRLLMPGDDRYVAATAIWAKPFGSMPRAVVHCRTVEDVQSAIRAVRDCDLPLSVRGGGHDWAGRALCDGVVIDLSGMNGVVIEPATHTARISGGARASDVVEAADPFGLAPVTGSVGTVGVAGLTLGGGYGPLIGRFGLALDNLLAAEVVLADGRVVLARDDSENELFWALRGGGGNFGVVTAMYHRLRDVPDVRSGMLIYPFAEAKRVLERCAEIATFMPDELTVQIGVAVGPDGPVVMIVPTWCGPSAEGEARLAPFFKLGTLLAGSLNVTPYGRSLTVFDPYLVNGQHEIMDTCWLTALDGRSIEVFVRAMEMAVSSGCAIFTHEFKGAASRVPEEATAFGLRRDHILIEILAGFVDRSDKLEERQHRGWVRATRASFEAMALPGAYPNLLATGDYRAAKSYGRNAKRLIEAKRRYDPDNVFFSAIPLPLDSAMAGAA
jgi:FAD/FMN-containing dehydrogenase